MWQQVKGKDIFIVDHHHEVLPAWISSSQRYNGPLPLISFDFHTDLHGAFLSYASIKTGISGNYDEIHRLADERLSEVDINDEKVSGKR